MITRNIWILVCLLVGAPLGIYLLLLLQKKRRAKSVEEDKKTYESMVANSQDPGHRQRQNILK